MIKIPIFKNFLATSYLKAFILEALVVSLISLATVTTHYSLSTRNGVLNKFFYHLFYGNDKSHKSHILKFEIILLINFLLTFLSVFCILLLLYVLIGFGGGMITPLNKQKREQIPFTKLLA